MRISIFGLGYVGAVTAGCLSSKGHHVVGVDVHPAKVEDFNNGIPPIVEPGLDELLKSAKEKGLLRATTDCDDAIADTELSIVCVSAPICPFGCVGSEFCEDRGRADWRRGDEEECPSYPGLSQ